MQMQTEKLITVAACSEELRAIDAAVRGYIQLLRFVVDPSHDREAVITQLRSFQQTYATCLMDWRTKQPVFTQSEQLISWQVTSFELLAFSTAVIGYLHMLEAARTPVEVRYRMITHLLTFEQRYMDQQAGLAINR